MKAITLQSLQSIKDAPNMTGRQKYIVSLVIEEELEAIKKAKQLEECDDETTGEHF